MELMNDGAMSTLSCGFKILKEVIDLAKNVKDLLPSGEKKDSISKSIDEIEKKTKEAESKIAKSLGYNLCQCTFPPQIMLSIGYRGSIEKFKCSNCNKIWPNDVDPSHLQMKVTDY